VRALQTSGDPWAEDPACYLTDNEIAPINGEALMAGNIMAHDLPGRFEVEKGTCNERQDYKDGQARRE
jgi:hypothetical protein